MQRITISQLIAALCILCSFAAVDAMARDLGAQRVSSTSAATNTITLTPPTGDTGRFTAKYIVFDAAAGQTQSVVYVSGGVTNTVGSKVIASGDKILAITNVPAMFSGDVLRVTCTGAEAGATNTVYLIGDLVD